MESNKYLEEFKIDIVHQYLQRRQKNLEEQNIPLYWTGYVNIQIF